MPLGVLNNISAIYAENNLNQTQASLQNTLTQLSSGSRINSGADDPAGLSIANGLEANSAALTQSSSNASEGVGFLQVADGALAQVTSLLTSAVTLATEAAGGTLSDSQMSAADQEYQDILSQIGTIGSTTEYNGIQVFSGDQTTSALTWGDNAVGTAASATVTASQIQSSALVTGGSTLSSTAPTVSQTFAAATAFDWTLSTSGTTGTLTSAAITTGAKLSGTLEFTSAGTGGATISQSLSAVTGGTLSAEATSLAGLLNTNYGSGGDIDYAVAVVSGDQLQISLTAAGVSDEITGLGATSGTTDQAAPNGFTLAVTNGDWLNGSINLSTSGTGTAPASPLSLAGVNTADLQSTVNLALNGTSANPDYTVSYNSTGGTLTVSLTSHAATDGITGFTATAGSGDNALAQSAAASGTITFTNGDTLGGEFTLTPTVNGTGSNAVTVSLAGVSTSNLVSTVTTALGNNAGDYNIGYNSTSGVLTISVSATGEAAGYDAVTLANGTGNNALSESGTAISNVVAANTLMGSFNVTPTTAAGAGDAVNVDLQGVTTANLASAVQTALGSDYTVSYNTTAGSPNLGDLNISVSATGAAAGITSFTAAEPTGGGAASQETPVVGGVNIYTGDGTSTGSKNYNVTVGVLSDAAVGTSASSSDMGTDITATVGGVTGTGGVLSGAGAGTSLTGTTLTSQADAEAALQTVDDAINAVAYQRGQVGANINTLTAASNIASAQQTNITSAENTITATDYASATSDMSKYEILTQTGISALAQANSTQQMVTKLLQ